LLQSYIYIIDLQHQHMMTKLFSTSPLMLGLIEDLELSLLRPFVHSYRGELGELNGLSHSIKEHGLLQPILVRSKEGYFEIIAGHRRFQACKRIGWRKIICHIIEADDKQAFEISLTENIERKSLNPIEEATAFKKYAENFGWGGISDLAARLGKSTSYIDKRIRLLDLPPKVLESIAKSSICTSTAEELLSIKDTKRQSELANLIRKNALSSRDTRQIIKNIMRHPVYDYDHDGDNTTYENNIRDIDKKTQKYFDKSIIALRIAMNKISGIIEESQENWIIYEILMQHKNMLHNQIDLLIKEKMKI
jgi:ParB family transcriptional regulator, chromosome partitioning protein